MVPGCDFLSIVVHCIRVLPYGLYSIITLVYLGTREFRRDENQLEASIAIMLASPARNVKVTPAWLRQYRRQDGSGWLRLFGTKRSKTEGDRAPSQLKQEDYQTPVLNSAKYTHAGPEQLKPGFLRLQWTCVCPSQETKKGKLYF